MTKVFNLLTDVTYEFDEHTTKEYALAYAYADEHGLMDALFYSCQNNTLDSFYKMLPVKFTYGEKSIGLDNWATSK
jgi:hypothetical protein